jgi:membrane protein DedA with SNARE-associated domain
MNLVDWPSLVDTYGNPFAGLGILIENAGVPFPGDALLLTAAAWTAARHHSFTLVIVSGFVGAIAGADIGYLLGYRGGRPFVERFGHLLHIRPEHLARAELFFARHGDKAILGSRFLLGLRTWSAMLAGMARMPFWRFQLFSAVGGLLWAASIGVVGYLLGSNLAFLETIVRAIGVGGMVILVLIALVLFVARERATRPR